MKTLIALIVFGLLALTLFAAAENPVGTWDVSAKSAETGEIIKATLTVKRDAGKLAGNLALENGGEFPISDAKLTGANFTFKLDINGSLYDVEMKLNGNKAAGKYSGGDGGGTIDAARKV